MMLLDDVSAPSTPKHRECVRWWFENARINWALHPGVTTIYEGRLTLIRALAPSEVSAPAPSEVSVPTQDEVHGT